MNSALKRYLVLNSEVMPEGAVNHLTYRVNVNQAYGAYCAWCTLDGVPAATREEFIREALQLSPRTRLTDYEGQGLEISGLRINRPNFR